MGDKQKENESLISDSALLSEFTQAWEQHRHLDNIRTKYLAFGFTVAFASIALLGGIIERINKDEIDAILLGVFVCLFALTVNDFIKTLVNDMSDVFPHYEDVWKIIRLKLLDDELEKLLNVRNSKKVINRKSKVGLEFGKIANVFQFIYCLMIFILIWKFFYVLL